MNFPATITLVVLRYLDGEDRETIYAYQALYTQIYYGVDDKKQHVLDKLLPVLEKAIAQPPQSWEELYWRQKDGLAHHKLACFLETFDFVQQYALHKYAFDETCHRIGIGRRLKLKLRGDYISFHDHLHQRVTGSKFVIPKEPEVRPEVKIEVLLKVHTPKPCLTYDRDPETEKEAQEREIRAIIAARQEAAREAERQRAAAKVVRKQHKTKSK